MDATQNTALAALAARRFGSFAEAAEAALGGLAEAVPGTIVLGRFDPDGEACRVTDLRGAPIAGLSRGVALRLVGPDEWIDPELLRGVGIESSLTVPLELSDGNVVGLLCALDRPAGAYRTDHLLLLMLAARILGYEWEEVRTQAELRGLREQVRDRGKTDFETGLINRDSVVEVLDREWRLAKRSSVRSFVVACRIEVRGSGGSAAAPVATLGLKDAADVLAGSARATDHVGRVGAMTLAAVLVGCDSPEGAQAFVDRYRRALDRATEGRPFAVTAACAFFDLEHADSAPEALARAEAGAESGDGPLTPPAPQQAGA